MVKDCKVYVRMKVLRYKLYREFQTFLIFKQTWGSVIINFIIKLFKSKDFVNNISYNSIFVIMERFIKYSKFIFINESHLIKDFVNIVVREVINNYRLLDEFIIDKSITFALQFFIIFIVKLGVNSKLSIVFHLQTDG